MEQQRLNQNQTQIGATYDRVAADYARELAAELKGKPFDRKMLDWLAERVAGAGQICDLGCGPGQVARYLFDRKVPVCGIDLSAGMIDQARLLHPAIEFATGDMRALARVSDGTFAGIAAFYAIVHLSPDELPPAYEEMLRVLKPGGHLLLTFHVGAEAVHRDEWWGKEVSIDFYFYEPKPIAELLRGAGFIVTESLEREPYPEVEYASRRAYVFAQKPQSEPQSTMNL